MDADVVVRRGEEVFHSFNHFFNPSTTTENEKRITTSASSSLQRSHLSLQPSLNPLSLLPRTGRRLRRPGCGGWTWAEEKGIETRCFPPLETRGAGKAALRAKAAEALADELLSFGGEERRASSDAASPSSSSSAPLLLLLRRRRLGFGVDVVALAGYLKFVPAPLVAPSPPDAQRAPGAAAGPLWREGLLRHWGARGRPGFGGEVLGPTVHFVDEVFDRGAILAQRAVPV